MWSRETLRHCAEKRNEHLVLPPDLERVLLAVERAMGRTEEQLRIAAAKQRLSDLLTLVDLANVPDNILSTHPLLLSARTARTHAPAQNAPALTGHPPPQPTPAVSFNLSAYLETLAAIDDARTDPKPPSQDNPKVIDLTPQRSTEQRRGGPSR